MILSNIQASPTIQDDDEVVVTEYLVGHEVRYSSMNGVMHCYDGGEWHKVSLSLSILGQTPGLVKFCSTHPDYVVVGVIIRETYQLPQAAFFATDLLHEGLYVETNRAYQQLFEYGVPMNPILNETEVFSEWGAMPEFWIKPLRYAQHEHSLAEGPSMVPIVGEGIIRRGIVFRHKNLRKILPGSSFCNV